MGSNVDLAGADAQAAGVGEFVSILGMRSRGETHDRQNACDALLLPEGSEAARSGVMTAKVYEYLAAGPPVLVVGPDAGTELGRLIVESGAGVCLGTDRAAIARAIGRVAAGDAHELSHRRIEVIARHERGRLAASFLHILRDAGLPLADPARRLSDGGTR
jgi:glycosyltransferase involved in cell wall biosynthesis